MVDDDGVSTSGEEDWGGDGEAEVEYASARPRYGTIRTTCTGFLTLIFTLVFLAMCAAALLMYQELPIGHYQDLDSVTMLYDHRKASRGIDAGHESFRTESWERDVVVTSFEKDVRQVSRYLPVALYCGGTPSLCEVDVDVECLSDLSAVNRTHSLNGAGDDLVASVALFATCGDFNALAWQERAGRIRVLYFAMNGVYPEDAGLDLETEQPFWVSWVCTNWNSLPAQLAAKDLACARTFDMCEPTSEAITAIRSAPSSLDFFRLANSSACSSGPSIQVYHNYDPIATLNLAERGLGWVSTAEVNTFLSESFAKIFGQGVAESYGRTSIASALLVGGQSVAFSFATEVGGNMKTANFVGMLASQIAIEAVPGTCPDTSHDIFHGTGTARLEIAAFDSSSVALVPVTMVAGTKYVSQYQVEDDGDFASLVVRRLSGLRVVVGKTSVPGSHAWRVVEATGVYGSADLSAQTVDVRVELRDVSEPQRVAVPQLEMEYYTMAFLALALIAGIIFFFLPFMMYHEYKQTLVKNGLPLPFFRYTTQFRGW